MHQRLQRVGAQSAATLADLCVHSVQVSCRYAQACRKFVGTKHLLIMHNHEPPLNRHKRRRAAAMYNRLSGLNMHRSGGTSLTRLTSAFMLPLAKARVLASSCCASPPSSRPAARCGAGSTSAAALAAAWSMKRVSSSALAYFSYRP